MELKSTINIILKDLEEARLIIDDLKNYPGVPLIQVELAKAKCRSAEDVIRLLIETDISSGQQTRDKESPTTTIQEGDPEEAKTEIKEVSEPELASPPLGEDKEISDHEEKIIADRFASTSSLNEQLGKSRKENGRPDMMRSRPIKELSTAIGINDRFYFIRELFDGDNNRYNKTITKLDSIKSIDEASELLANETSQPDYSEPFQQLLELVGRKLLSDK